MLIVVGIGWLIVQAGGRERSSRAMGVRALAPIIGFIVMLSGWVPSWM